MTIVYCCRTRGAPLPWPAPSQSAYIGVPSHLVGIDRVGTNESPSESARYATKDGCKVRVPAETAIFFCRLAALIEAGALVPFGMASRGADGATGASGASGGEGAGGACRG